MTEDQNTVVEGGGGIIPPNRQESLELQYFQKIQVLKQERRALQKELSDLRQAMEELQDLTKRETHKHVTADERVKQLSEQVRKLKRENSLFQNQLSQAAARIVRLERNYPQV